MFTIFNGIDLNSHQAPPHTSSPAYPTGIRKCPKESDLDCDLNLCSGIVNENTVKERPESLHNSTNFEHY